MIRVVDKHRPILLVLLLLTVVAVEARRCAGPHLPDPAEAVGEQLTERVATHADLVPDGVGRLVEVRAACLGSANDAVKQIVNERRLPPALGFGQLGGEEVGREPGSLSMDEPDESKVEAREGERSLERRWRKMLAAGERVELEPGLGDECQQSAVGVENEGRCLQLDAERQKECQLMQQPMRVCRRRQ